MRSRLTEANSCLMERLHELKKSLFSALKLSDLLHTGPEIGAEKGTLVAHVNAPLFTLCGLLKLGFGLQVALRKY